MSKQIKGRAEPYFETGTEGTYWAVHDENYKPWDYEGLNIIRQNDHLSFEYKDAQGDLFLLCEVEINFVDSRDAERNKYFKQYLKAHDSGLRQLNFAGIWVHKLPTNVDLGLWYQVFFGSERDSYVLTLKPALEKATLKSLLKHIRF